VSAPRAEVIVVRHAPVAVPGVLAGRSDLPARLSPDAIAACRTALPEPMALWASPAQRCLHTAEALFPATDIHTDARLWEQDFGALDGHPFAEMPDLGPMLLPDLAAHSWPDGESFAEMCARCRPALVDLARQAEALGGPVICVAHAGVARAALALALDCVPGALAFEIAPLSRTRFTVYRGALAGIVRVNETAE